LSADETKGTETQPKLCHPEPERTRIFYYVAPAIASRAAFRKESRMKFANATKL
jgi:hypothetical protein